MNKFRSAETVFSELCPGQFLTVCLDKLLAETWAVVTSIVIKWSQDDKVDCFTSHYLGTWWKGGKSSGKDGTLKTETLLSELPFAWLSRVTQLWQVARSLWVDVFSIIPPCTMKYVVKATCRIKRHSKTKASQILWLIIPQSACRVDLPGSQILNLCNSCVSAPPLLQYVIHYIWNAGLQKHNKYVWWWWWSFVFVFFLVQRTLKELGLTRESQPELCQKSLGNEPPVMSHHILRGCWKHTW